jgi:hypothetical protein
MIPMPAGTQIWVACGVTDMRKGYDGLAMLVQEVLKKSPHSGHMFVFRVINRYVGNLPPMPGVFPDYPAPVVRNAGSDREMVLMRWGMPPPPRAGGPPVTNIRNTSSPQGQVTSDFLMLGRVTSLLQ